MQRSTVIAGVILATLAVAGGGVVIGIVRHGISARDEPTIAEALMARCLRHLAVPSAQRGLKNPIARTDEVLSQARAHFADHCALCHGNDGKGQTEIGRHLYPKTPDMTSPGTQSLSDGELFYIIKNGVRLTGMPAWGDETPESDRDSWHLVHFIRHLPAITQEELDEEKTLNPRSPQEATEEELEKRFLAGEDVPQLPQHHH